jgi:hypothetical protein
MTVVTLERQMVIVSVDVTPRLILVLRRITTDRTPEIVQVRVLLCEEFQIWA